MIEQSQSMHNSWHNPARACPVFNKLTWHEPAIQSKTSIWIAVNFKKHVTSMSCTLEPAIWSHDTGQQIPCFDRCLLIITLTLKFVAYDCVYASFPWKLNRYSYGVQFGINCTALDQSKLSNFVECTISNCNRTEWSPIQSVIIRVITKSDDRAAGVRFVYHEYDYRLNWTTRSPIIN